MDERKFRELCRRTVLSFGPMGRGWVFCQQCQGVPTRLDLSQGWEIVACTRCNGSGYEQESPQCPINQANPQ